MHRRASRAPQRYDTAIDRAGLALGAGSALAGLIVLALVLLGGQSDPLNLLKGWLIGSVFSGIAITAVGGPIWLALHVAGLRRAWHAALVGAMTAMLIFVGAQTYGFGMFAMPEIDGRTWLFRWLSALASSALLAVISAIIAALMWRIAYRRRTD
ncbi:hypothetical protein E5A74_19280 [Sphingomonas naasensis]|uniref:Uncharacterized protein n=1 Tax=Sphingomonas naasensis TaxID=1344951 RepID=A0A4V3QVA8_9SPHN|nr:hypothetical protein E5A74_19280 [Sphingomonas naasensis]